MQRPLTTGQDKQKERKGMSFRGQLITFGLCLAALASAPALVAEIPRPWEELDNLIGRGHGVLAGVRTGFASEDLARMNRFALSVSVPASLEDEDYLTWAFNLLLLEGGLPPEKEMKKAIAASDSERKDFEYQGVEKAVRFWEDRFAADPGVKELFQKYKRRLLQIKEYSGTVGFDYSDVYVMVDDGKTFAFLVDGMEWPDSSYPGLVYDVTLSHDEYWRAYLDKGPGFDHNPKFYHLHLFPKFDTDKWGTWFTIWLAEKEGDVYNVFSMDFEATQVKRTMGLVAAGIVGSVLVLGLVIALVTRRLSRMIVVPIQNLLVGTAAVMETNFDHEVPSLGSPEFKRLIATFNLMLAALKERFHLMKTLETLLSKELAEQAGRHGLVLEGQKVDITNIFAEFVGFSDLSQRMAPEEIVKTLNEYLEVLIPIVKKWGGLPEKYLGDTIAAVFGAPIQLENHAEFALSCAIEMQRMMRRINEDRKREGRTVLEMRIGINSGEIIARSLGRDMKLEYTAIGETISLARRLAAMAEIGHILMTENTSAKLKHIFFKGLLISHTPEPMKLKGCDQPSAGYTDFVYNHR
jgi:class 3 adenylate cyclase